MHIFPAAQLTRNCATVAAVSSPNLGTGSVVFVLEKCFLWILLFFDFCLTNSLRVAIFPFPFVPYLIYLYIFSERGLEPWISRSLD